MTEDVLISVGADTEVVIVVGNRYIMVSNNDKNIAGNRIILSHITLIGHNFVHNDQNHAKLYIFGKYVSRSLQKYILSWVYDNSV